MKLKSVPSQSQTSIQLLRNLTMSSRLSYLISSRIFKQSEEWKTNARVDIRFPINNSPPNEVQYITVKEVSLKNVSTCRRKCSTAFALGGNCEYSPPASFQWLSTYNQDLSDREGRKIHLSTDCYNTDEEGVGYFAKPRTQM
jgi:hypothetical protein